MVGLAAALLLPLSLTLPGVLWCTRDSACRYSWLLAIAVAPALGLGISSCVFFLWPLSPRPCLANLVGLEMLLYVPAGAAFSLALFANRSRSEGQAQPRLHGNLVFITVSGSLIVLVCSSLAFAMFLRASPHGDFDASAIWNLRARFLYRLGPGRWQDAFPADLPWSHPDYPLLLPASVARCWLYAQTETTWAPRLIAGIFTFGVAGLLFAGVARLRSSNQGWLALATLLATAKFIDVGSAQYADVPLSFYVLASLVFLVMADNEPKRAVRCEALSGILVGMAAWTKNEGALCLVVLLTVRLASLLMARPLGQAIREFAPCALGALPVVIILFYFKLSFAPFNDLVAGWSGASVFQKLSDPSRYWEVAKSFGNQVARVGWGMAYFLAAYGLLVGRAPKCNRKTGAGQALATVCLLVLGYFIVYLMTYWYLPSHLKYSVKRLWLHFYPLAIFTFFLYVSTPEEALTIHSHAFDAESPNTSRP